ncbi:MAG TPA: NAD(P)/FAD-dependent oxidoreductase [Methanomicrobia archaeon]|nr:NAD(P)/FAD-dependent oxidoreductase [Methanomicrobia archaeon]
MQTERYDLVVVGAGPAGSSTAKTAAEQGLDVLLIERNAEIGVPVRCAEGVSKEIEQFVEIDQRWVCTAPRGMILYGPDGTAIVLSVADGTELGYVVDRRLFDKALAQQAAHAGAEVRVKTRASGLIRADGGVNGVYATTTGEPVRICADVVVGADGVESQIGRWAGLDTCLPLSEIAICAQYLMCNITVNTAFYETYFGSAIAPKGYAWIFPKGPDSANIGLGISGDMSGESRRARDYLDVFVSTRFPEGTILAKSYGAVPLSGPVYETVANGLLLVGDAARHVNPANGGGILQALQGGAIAGEVIANAIRARDVSKRGLQGYEKRWRREFGKVLTAGLRLKQVLTRLDDPALTQFFHSLGGEIMVKEYSERACMKELLIRKNPRVLVSLLRLLF